jgi:hypothetical protein
MTYYTPVLGIRIQDPDFYPSGITDLASRFPKLKSATKERAEKKIKFSYLFCRHKFHKIESYFIFEMLKKEIWASFQRIAEVFTQKSVTKLSKIWVWDPGVEIQDPGSGKNLFRILDPGSKSTGSRIRIRNTATHSKNEECS